MLQTVNRPDTAGAASGAGSRGLATLTIGAIGVVHGGIGTSPLYAIDQIFLGSARIAPDPPSVVGAISLAFWTLTLIVSVKYALLVLRAENEGEGGVFALYGLLHPYKRAGASVILLALMLGAGLLFGDGMITPAISVLSAVEGVGIATPAFAHFIVPITLALLAALFLLQSRGTAGVGALFGPLLIAWFVTIAALGAAAIWRTPAILAAFSPWPGIAFLAQATWREALLILGALMLVVTGGEAMYADLGHFGARPIRIGWFALAYPALVFNYFGQGAHLLSGAPVAGGKLFYALAPSWGLVPLVVLATASTVVASQALISGAFSIASQAIGLGLLPRITVRHTHQAHAGQIYVPFVNAALFVGCAALVLGFGSSNALAAAYGLAVAGVMLITSVAMFAVARRHWRWSAARTALVWTPMSALNAALFVASLAKFVEGGYVPLSVGLAVFAAMTTWRWGRKATFAAYASHATMTMGEVVALHRAQTHFIERNALVMAPHPLRALNDRAPALIEILWRRYGQLPRNLIIVEVTHPKAPYVREGRYRITVFDRDPGRGSVIGVELRFGFMEEPNVERLIEELARHREIDLPPHPSRWIVHVAHENLLPARKLRMHERLRFRLFMLLRLVSRPTYYAYGLGDEVQLSAEVMPVRIR